MRQPIVSLPTSAMNEAQQYCQILSNCGCNMSFAMAPDCVVDLVD